MDGGQLAPPLKLTLINQSTFWEQSTEFSCCGLPCVIGVLEAQNKGRVPLKEARLKLFSEAKRHVGVGNGVDSVDGVALLANDSGGELLLAEDDGKRVFLADDGVGETLPVEDACGEDLLIDDSAVPCVLDFVAEVLPVIATDRTDSLGFEVAFEFDNVADFSGTELKVAVGLPSE